MMEFRETLTTGMVVSTKRELHFHKKHDTHVSEMIPGNTQMTIWGFERFSEDADPQCEVEVDFLHGADIWTFPIPRGEFLTDYFRTGL